MLRISKTFAFSASHQLDHLPADHPCARLHGHNYEVTVILEAYGVGSQGFVRDFRDLGIVKRFIDSAWDHRHLNDVVPGGGPMTTSEALATYLFQEFHSYLPELACVRVSETPKTYAEYWSLNAISLRKNWSE